MSPFETFEEFAASKGAIYPFCENTAVMGFLAVVCTVITVYWLYTTYSIPENQEKRDD